MLSALYVKFRDINYVWEVLLQGGFYATPILYPISMIITVSPVAAKMLMVNPIAQLTQDLRALLIHPETLTINDVFSNDLARLIPLSIVILFAVVSIVYFRKQSPRFAEDI